MEFSTELNEFDEDSIEPCRTCGIYFAMGMNMDLALVKPIFGGDTSARESMQEILEQMNEWNLKVVPEDKRPQYICVSCIAEFRRMLKFKRSCLEMQDQFDDLEVQRGIVIKREIDIEPVDKFCGFIYVDTDDEEISDEDGSRRVCAAFDIPHVPIKEEHMARVPVQNETHFQTPEPKEIEPQVDSSFNMMETDELTHDIYAPSSADVSENNEEDDPEEEIIKFTYDDDGDDAISLPEPIHSPCVCCKLCQHESPNQEMHLDHMRRTHLLKDWDCHMCGKKFTNAQESRLKFHMKWHKLQRHLKCPICGFFCNSKDTLKEHKQAVHTRAKCPFCGKNVKQNLLQSHLNKHLNDREAELAKKMNILQQKSMNSSATLEKTPVARPARAVFISATATKPSPAPLAYFDPALPPMSSGVIIQCAFCTDTFDEHQKLLSHVRAMHQSPKQPTRSPGKISSTIRPTERLPSPIPQDMKESVLLQRDSTDVSFNGSTLNQTTGRYYPSCHICGKEFNLNIKLNRHLKQHTKAPF
ncbi:hypothetical protein KR009_001659 [Drosophila setifemur]|nr:hypothetical protein KR009_001659 [Drosophila setifemur]